MNRQARISLLIVVYAFTVLAGISCAQRQESSIFMIECNIVGLDIELMLGGYSPVTVESNLVIPFVKYLSSNKNLKSIKYQINPTYFRIFITASNPKGEIAMHNELLSLINGLPNVSELLNSEGVAAVLDKHKVYVASNNLYVGTADQFHILGKPLVLPISGMTEQNISSLVPDITGKRLLVKCNKSRLVQLNIQFRDVRDIISARYLNLKEGSSLVLTDVDSLKELSLPNDSGMQIFLKDIAQFEYTTDGINRPWTPFSQFRE